MTGPQQMAPDPEEILHHAVDRGEPLERLCVDAVRLRELAGRSGEVADLARIRHDHRHLHRRQRRDGRPFVPARFPDVD